MSNTKTKRDDVDATRRRLLDGLMASDATAWEHTLFRTRLYAGYDDPTTSWVPRAHASMRERGGDWGTSPAEAHELPYNNQVSTAHAAITEKGWWERRRRRNGEADDGPGTPWETRLRDAFPAERKSAHSTLAYAAIKSLSLHVSPLGPERERALCRCWYLVGRDNTCVGSRQQWADRLGCTPRWAKKWLEDLAAADVGVELEVRPPSGHEKAKQYVVRLSLPPIERTVLPSGGARHAQEDGLYQEFRSWMLAQQRRENTSTPGLASSASAPAGTYYAEGPGGTLVEVAAEDDYLPPWLEEDGEETDTDVEDWTDSAPEGDLEASAAGDGDQAGGAAPPAPGSELAAAKELVGVQLQLDSRDGQHLVRTRAGALRYEAPAPPASAEDALHRELRESFGITEELSPDAAGNESAPGEAADALLIEAGR